MRTSKAVERCASLIHRLAEAGFTSQVSEPVLRKLIKAEIGADPRTVKNWIANLEDFGFIRRSGVRVWCLELGRVEGALELAVGGERQKRLV